MIMSATDTPFNHMVAFDIGKDQAVVHILPGDARYIAANKPKAIRKLLIAQMRRNAKDELGPLLVICEATGGYERDLLDICVELGLAAHKAHGARVRHFAKYLGMIAKTDPIDARILARYGLETKNLRLYIPLTPEITALRDLKTRRDQVLRMRVAETNRLEHTRHKSVNKSLKAHIIGLRKDVAAIEAEIAAHLTESETLAQKVRLMRSLKGVGPVTAATLLAHMPELGTFTKGQAACIAGLAPINNDSGKSRGPRHVEAGRAAVRATLYMAALAAIRRNDVMRRFADALRRKGKPAKVVITAVMRKMIVTLNAMLKVQEPWRHAQSA